MMRDAGQLVEPTQRERPDRGGSRQRLAQSDEPLTLVRAAVVRRLAPEHIAAANELHVGAGLAQQRRQLAGTLPAPDHRDALAPPLVEAGVAGGVAHQCLRRPFERRRNGLLVGQAHGDHDAPGTQRLAVLQDEAEPAAGLLDPEHLAVVEIGDGLLRKPFAVTDELLERNLLLPFERMLVPKAIEREPLGGIGDVGCVPGRQQLHPFRHAVAPGRHRVAERAGAEAGGFEVRGHRETVRPGADHGHFAFVGQERYIHGTTSAVDSSWVLVRPCRDRETPSRIRITALGQMQRRCARRPRMPARGCTPSIGANRSAVIPGRDRGMTAERSARAEAPPPLSH